MDCEILGLEDNWHKRGIKEAIYIRRYQPTLNKDKGRYILGHIWDKAIDKTKNKGKILIGQNSGRNTGGVSNGITH